MKGLEICDRMTPKLQPLGDGSIPPRCIFCSTLFCISFTKLGGIKKKQGKLKRYDGRMTPKHWPLGDGSGPPRCICFKKTFSVFNLLHHQGIIFYSCCNFDTSIFFGASTIVIPRCICFMKSFALSKLLR